MSLRREHRFNTSRSIGGRSHGTSTGVNGKLLNVILPASTIPPVSQVAQRARDRCATVTRYVASRSLNGNPTKIYRIDNAR